MTQPQYVECFRCNNCGNVTAVLNKVCQKCGSIDIEMTQSEGKGELVDFTNVYYPPDNYTDIAPYTSVLVRLSNGCKLFGVIEGEIKDVQLGRPVTMVKHDKGTGRIIFQL